MKRIYLLILSFLFINNTFCSTINNTLLTNVQLIAKVQASGGYLKVSGTGALPFDPEIEDDPTVNLYVDGNIIVPVKKDSSWQITKEFSDNYDTQILLYMQKANLYNPFYNFSLTFAIPNQNFLQDIYLTADLKVNSIQANRFVFYGTSQHLIRPIYLIITDEDGNIIVQAIIRTGDKFITPALENGDYVLHMFVEDSQDYMQEHIVNITMRLAIPT